MELVMQQWNEKNRFKSSKLVFLFCCWSLLDTKRNETGRWRWIGCWQFWVVQWWRRRPRTAGAVSRTWIFVWKCLFSIKKIIGTKLLTSLWKLPLSDLGWCSTTMGSGMEQVWWSCGILAGEARAVVQGTINSFTLVRGPVVNLVVSWRYEPI